MVMMNIFQSPCFIEDIIFSAAESIQKKNMVTANCVLRKKWINLAGIKWMVAFKNLIALLWNILRIYRRLNFVLA